MSRPTRPQLPGADIPTGVPYALERCPRCGGARTVTTDGLTGRVTTRCDDCERNAERARLRANQERAALTIVARTFGLSEEEVRRRLTGRVRAEPRARSPRAQRPDRCQHCGAPMAHSTRGRIRYYCSRRCYTAAYRAGKRIFEVGVCGVCGAACDPRRTRCQEHDTEYHRQQRQYWAARKGSAA